MGKLTLVRHGQASFLSDEYDRLSEMGEEQSRLLGKHWGENGAHFDRFVAGPLVRQRRTAEICAEAMVAAGGAPPALEIMDGLAEFPVEALAKDYLPLLFGEEPRLTELIMEFQNEEDPAKKDAAFQGAFEIVTHAWRTGRFEDSPVESWVAFSERVEHVLHNLTDRRNVGQSIAAFSSSGPVSMAVRAVMEGSGEAALALAWHIRNASLTEILITQQGPLLHSLNDVAHLPSADYYTIR